MPRVVWVSQEITAEPRSGGALRTNRLITSLARHAEVTVIALDQHTDGDAFCRATGAHGVVSFAPLSGWAARRVALTRRWPVSVARYWNDDAFRLVQRLSNEGAHVVLDLVFAAAYRPPDRPYTISTENVEAEVLETLPMPAAIGRRLERVREIRLLRQWEDRAVRMRGARVVAVSAEDQRRLGGSGIVIPNGADVPESPSPVPASGPLLFVGSLNYPPNELAVRWWVDAVWPHMAPGTQPLTVVGRFASLVEDLRHHRGIRLVGEVDSVEPYLDSAALVVVPLVHGGGTRLKVLEALAWRRPVLSTSKGIEGLGLSHGSDVWVADDPAAFASAAVSLIADHNRRAQLGDAGRIIGARFGWPALGEKFSDYVLSSASGLTSEPSR